MTEVIKYLNGLSPDLNEVFNQFAICIPKTKSSLYSSVY